MIRQYVVFWEDGEDPNGDYYHWQTFTEFDKAVEKYQELNRMLSNKSARMAQVLL